MPSLTTKKNDLQSGWGYLSMKSDIRRVRFRKMVKAVPNDL